MSSGTTWGGGLQGLESKNIFAPRKQFWNYFQPAKITRGSSGTPGGLFSDVENNSGVSSGTPWGGVSEDSKARKRESKELFSAGEKIIRGSSGTPGELVSDIENYPSKAP